jgi:hypothetical protein
VQYGIENRPHFADGITQGEGITSAQSTARAPGNYATRQHPDHDTHEWPPTSVGNDYGNRIFSSSIKAGHPRFDLAAMHNATLRSVC